jgi:hypothetical protein
MDHRIGATERCRKISFREIFGIVRFSTFATVSATSDILRCGKTAHYSITWLAMTETS